MPITGDDGRTQLNRIPGPGQHRLALPVGYELGRYRFQQVLGSGGFGITYLAVDKTLERRVAVKELLPNDIATRIDGTTVVAKTESEEQNLAWARERFVAEGRALAACDHPNVVNVYEMVEANGTAYMITKYEDGCSLEQWLKDLGRAPNEKELRDVLMPLLSGLETVHAAGFLHRDIKPENIYITKNGRPVLLDFGSARQAISNRSMAMTSIVTSGYAPLEQYHEDGNQGAWSDIYALASVMYRSITGRKPPEATRRLKDDPCEKLSTRYAGQYDAEFLRAIDQGLTVDEDKRPQTVASWRKAFGSGENFPTEIDVTRVIPRAARVAKPAQPPWMDFVMANPAVVGGAVGAVLLIALFSWFLLRTPANPHPAVVTVTPTPAPQVSASASPTPADLQPQPSPHTLNSPGLVIGDGTPAPSPGLGISPSPNQSTNAAQLDPRLVGKWQTAKDAPKNLRNLRWEQSADGHYVFSGPISDTGAMTSAGEGKIRQFSNSASQPVDVSYEFKSDKLVTTGPLGTAEWHRTDGGNQQRQNNNGPSDDGTPRGGHHNRGGNVHHDLIKRVFRHFP